MKNLFLLFYFGLLAQSGFNQNKLELVAHLTEDIEETSALVYYHGSFWTINDSGGEPAIYSFDREGKQISKIVVNGAENIDWEALAINDTHLFIGDFGNNFGNRKDLKIYAIKLDELKKPMADLDFIINFQYPEQKSRKKTIYKTQFDCEAMIADSDYIHLFTKDWKYFRGSHYILNIKKGKQEAKFQVFLNADGLITDAVLNDGTLYLIGYKDYNALFWQYDFKNLKTYQKRIELKDSYKYQVEGITYFKDTLFITSEKSAVPQALFYLTP